LDKRITSGINVPHREYGVNPNMTISQIAAMRTGKSPMCYLSAAIPFATTTPLAYGLISGFGGPGLFFSLRFIHSRLYFGR